MSLYYSAVSFSKTLICFSGIHNYVKAERFSEPGTHSYVHASICIHYSGISGHEVKHAQGSGRSCMHLTENPAQAASWTRSCCKKCIAWGHFQKTVFILMLEITILPTKKGPSSNQNKPSQAKIKVREQRSSPQSPVFFSVVILGLFSAVWPEPNFYWFQWNQEACRDCRTVPSIWQLLSFQYDTITFSIWEIISKT